MEGPCFPHQKGNCSPPNAYLHRGWKPLVKHCMFVRIAHFLSHCYCQNRLYHLKCFKPLALLHLLGSFYRIDEKNLLLRSLPKSTMTFEINQWISLYSFTCQSVSWKEQSLHSILLWISQALLFILRYHLAFDFFFYSSALFRYQSASSSFEMDQLSKAAC